MLKAKFDVRNSIFDHKTAGFTLIELVIVLFIITLILSLSTIYVSGHSASARIDSTAREIAATMKYARSLARANHEKQIITIDLDAKRYRIEGRKESVIPKDLRIKVIDQFSGEIYSGKHIMVYPVTGAAGNENIVLWNDKKELHIRSDPVVGSVIIKQQSGIGGQGSGVRVFRGRESGVRDREKTKYA